MDPELGRPPLHWRISTRRHPMHTVCRTLMTSVSSMLVRRFRMTGTDISYSMDMIMTSKSMAQVIRPGTATTSYCMFLSDRPGSAPAGKIIRKIRGGQPIRSAAGTGARPTLSQINYFFQKTPKPRRKSMIFPYSMKQVITSDHLLRGATEMVFEPHMARPFIQYAQISSGRTSTPHDERP